MSAKLLLCISQERVTAAVWRMRRLQKISVFANSQAGLAEFDAYLGPQKGLPVRILVDTLSEDYRFETLPHASGSDRAQLLGRKLRQLYRATSFVACEAQERLSAARREDRYLFAALTDPELLLPWLRVIEQHRLPVAGIHPLPLVTLGLMDTFRLKQQNLLLVSKNSAGLRQTFCRNQKFKISRLTASRDGVGPADAYYAEEVGNTRMYLDALTVTHVDDTINVVIFDHDDSLRGIPEALARDRRNVQCVLIGREEIARRLSIPAADLARSPDVLHLHVLATGGRFLDLAPAHVEAGFQVYRLRQYGYIASGAVLAAALLWAGVATFQAMQLDEEVVLLARQTGEYQRRYAEVTAHFPQAPATAAELQHTVEAAEQIRSQLRTPKEVLVLISRALEASPEVTLRRIEWRYGDAKTMDDLSFKVSATAARRQIAVVSAEVVKEAQDHRAVLERIRAFAAALGSNARVEEVQVLKLPMDMTSEAALSGTTAESARPPQAHFQVAILLRGEAT
jgi:hypothetical protein